MPRKSTMKRKNKILIEIIAAVVFIVAFVLCGCDKNLPDTVDKPSSIQQTLIPTVQNANTVFKGTDSLAVDARYDLKGYGTYAP
jgi:hypothetical protein